VSIAMSSGKLKASGNHPGRASSACNSSLPGNARTAASTIMPKNTRILGIYAWSRPTASSGRGKSAKVGAGVITCMGGFSNFLKDPDQHRQSNEDSKALKMTTDESRTVIAVWAVQASMSSGL
ncbi:MAG: hypothetical protein LC676_19010, partial [Loktanella sp.]|nr:hypothetical protein [Loktanella sp.]